MRGRIERNEEAVPTPRIGPNVAWTRGVVVQGQPDLSNQRVEATIDIDRRARPQGVIQLLPAHQLTAPRSQDRERPDRLRSQLDPCPAPAEFVRLRVDLEVLEPQARQHGWGGRTST
jgi:hypothetical protein